MNTFFKLFLTTGTAWTALVMFRFLLPKNRNSEEAPYAFFVIVIFLLNILDNLLRPHLIPMRYLDYIYPITRLSYYIVGPALLIYTQKLLKENFKLNKKQLLHLIPFIIMFIYVTIDPQSLHPKKPFGMVDELNRINEDVPLFPMEYIWLLTKNLSRLIYSIIILVLIRRNYTQLPDRVSNINNRNALSWLKFLIICYTGIYLANTLVQFIVPEELYFYAVSAAIARNLPPVLFIFFFSLFSDNQHVIVQAAEPEIKAETGENNKKYEKSGITEDDSKIIYSELCDFITESKVYLEPELTLTTLSEQANISRHKISEVINRVSGKKFYTFINEFRLKEFENSIKENLYPDYTIIAIAFECGFRSSSGFYGVVKKEYNTTPKALVEQLKAG